ncbi:MAG: inner membrane CreD family protein [Gammaproteobacteria bacterium]|nr:inner membrane CreD family protein [Gammaproteobacteria bacterium]
MIKRLIAIGFIFACTAIAWGILGGTIFTRTYSSDSDLKSRVERIWGTPQAQHVPTASYTVERTEKEESLVDGKKVVTTKKVYDAYSLPLMGSDVLVKLGLDYRQKGLLWYSTYITDFAASYRFRNDTNEHRATHISFPFPAQGANYDDFKFSLRDGSWTNRPEARDGAIDGIITLDAGQEVVIDVTYKSQGLDQWRYLFGDNAPDNTANNSVTAVRDFRLVMETDFNDIDFPDDSIAPTFKERTEDGGWRLVWQYENLIAGVNIGMLMPQKLQPGPLAGQISLFAPVSLFFFIVVMLVLSIMQRIDLHPMHFFFLSAAFFAFHLLLAYLVDHLPIHAAFALASVVSLALVASYLHAVISARFALLAAAAQWVYLVLFSYAFFFKGFTGIAVTVGAVLTLFVMMQLTARTNWTEVFGKNS